jgi:tetratricopeptide (TPR) repeat protein
MTNNLTPSGELVLEQLGINPNNLSTDFPTREQRLQYRAVVQWLTDYKPKRDATNLEKVKGCIQAFYHLCDVEDWERGIRILVNHLKQLSTWGYYRENLDLHKRLLGKLNLLIDAMCLQFLGGLYDNLGDYTKAIESNQQSVKVVQEIPTEKLLEYLLYFYSLHLTKDFEPNTKKIINLFSWLKDNPSKVIEDYPDLTEDLHKLLLQMSKKKDLFDNAPNLRGLGNIYYVLGDYAKALEYYEQDLERERIFKNRRGEGAALGNLGLVYHALGDFKKAFEFQQESLMLARELGDRLGEMMALGELGNIYFSIKDYPNAFDNSQQALLMAQSLQHRTGQEDALRNLGNIYLIRGEYATAIEYQQQSLTIAKETGNRLGEAHSLGNIGFCYFGLENYSKAIKYCQEGLMIAREIKVKKIEESILGNLGNFYCCLGDYTKAMEYQQQSLTLVRELKDRHGERKSLDSIARIYMALEDYATAIEYYRKSVLIAHEVGDFHSEGDILCDLGYASIEIEKYLEASAYFMASLVVCKGIGNPSTEVKVQNGLEIISERLGRTVHNQLSSWFDSFTSIFQ